MQNKKIIINGNQYTLQELREKPNKDLHLEVLLTLSNMQGDVKTIAEHIKVQDKANADKFESQDETSHRRFLTHEWIMAVMIVGLVCMIIKIFL